jgi:hypothetical protein
MLQFFSHKNAILTLSPREKTHMTFSKIKVMSAVTICEKKLFILYAAPAKKLKKYSLLSRTIQVQVARSLTFFEPLYTNHDTGFFDSTILLDEMVCLHDMCRA